MGTRPALPVNTSRRFGRGLRARFWPRSRQTGLGRTPRNHRALLWGLRSAGTRESYGPPQGPRPYLHDDRQDGSVDAAKLGEETEKGLKISTCAY